MSRLQQTSITTSADREVSFVGNLVADATSMRVDLPGGALWFHLQVWSRQDGGYVPVIEIHLDGDQSTRFVESEIVDTETDVENFFFVFETEAIVPSLLPDVLSKEEKDRQSQEAFAAFERQVNALLGKFHAALGHDSQPVEDDSLANPRPNL